MTLEKEAGAPVLVYRSTSRNDALDWTKGALVVCMVIYHGINYSAFRPMSFRYLGFLPPSFILIAGFLVGQVYAAKYDLESWKPYLRLMTRGIKLYLIFALLNLVSCIAVEHSFLDGMDEFASRSRAIFLSGNERAGIFEVLLPIAYFLLLSPALLWLQSRTRSAIPVCAVVVFLFCQALEMQGHSLKNLNLLSAGIIGMALGMVKIETFDRVARKWIVVLPPYIFYRFCSQMFGESYPVQMFGALVSVLLLYSCALHWNCSSWFQGQIITLGKYSLLGYLAQIAILRGMAKLLPGRADHVFVVFAAIVLATVLTLLLVKGVHEFCQQSRVARVIYKSIFA